MRRTPAASVIAAALMGGALVLNAVVSAHAQQGFERRPLPPPPGAAAPGSAAAAPSNGAVGVPSSAITDSLGDVVVVQPPSVKIPNQYAVFAGLDKITGRITSFEVAMNETAQFGALQVTPRACYTRPPTEQQDTTSFTEVNEVTLKGEAKRIFTGWMFASSPGLHGVEHPIYDVWLMGCKTALPVAGQPSASR